MRRNSAVTRGGFSVQAGFSLPETLVAALLFAVSLLGLLQYQQVLQQSFQHQSQQRQAWRLAMQQLEAYEAGVSSLPADTDSGVDNGSANAVSPAVDKGWQASLSEHVQTEACHRVTVMVMTPRRYQATLSRWFCRLSPFR